MELIPDSIEAAYLEGNEETIGRFSLGFNGELQLNYRPGGVEVTPEEQNFLTKHFPTMADPEAAQIVHAVTCVDGQGDILGYASFHITPDGEISLSLCAVDEAARKQGISKELHEAVFTIINAVMDEPQTRTTDGRVEITSGLNNMRSSTPRPYRESLRKMAQDHGFEPWDRR